MSAMPSARGHQTTASATAVEQPKASKHSHKRKRDEQDYNGHAQARSSTSAGDKTKRGPSQSLDELPQQSYTSFETDMGQKLRAATSDGVEQTQTAAAALAVKEPHRMVGPPRPTGESFASSNLGNDDDPTEPSFDLSMDQSQGGTAYHTESFTSNGNLASPIRIGHPMGGKPAVGTDEWNKIRKDNHKEVERRRRETINEGINELQKIVPGCDKQKGAVLNRTVSFINQLKENEQKHIEKWTLEKLLTDQAIAELSAINDRLKSELEKERKESSRLRKMCVDAGLKVKTSKAERSKSTGSDEGESGSTVRS